MDDFSIQHEHIGDMAIVTISGRVDSVTAAGMDSELEKFVHDHKKIILNLKGAEYMSSAGVRAIMKVLQSAKKSEGWVKLASVPDRVMEVLQTVGVLEMLEIYPTVAKAVASC